MSYAARLTEEINTVLDLLAEEGKEWRAPWITHEICNGHSRGLAEGNEASVDFWRHCGYTECRREVTRCINSRAGDKATTDQLQMTLPGYKHLQLYYVVDRDGEKVGIPISSMTEMELRAKAAHYRAMAASCFAHADELDRYRKLSVAA